MNEPCPTPRKISYPNREHSQRAMANAWKNPYKGGQHLPIRTYKCQCGRWHMTSSPQRKKVTA